MVTLVIGGARSGKSRYAQSLGADASQVVYVAPLRAEDPEMEARIAQHRRDRPAHWITVEEPLDIAGAVERYRDADCILVDCLTLWLSNLCWEHRADNGPIEGAALAQLARVAAVPEARVVLVTNEVGYGYRAGVSGGKIFPRFARPRESGSSANCGRGGSSGGGDSGGHQAFGGAALIRRIPRIVIAGTHSGVAPGYRVHSVIASYIHLHFLASPGFAHGFVERCAQRQ